MSGARVTMLESQVLLDLCGVRHGLTAAPPAAWPAAVWRPRQVHGASVAEPRSSAAPAVDADAAVSGASGPAVGVVTADCVPVLLATRDGRAVGAVHAGWRGIAAGVLERSIVHVAALGDGAEICAAIGPAAGGCCYEVGPEVVAALRPAASRIARSPRGRTLLDLRGVVADRVRAAGIAQEALDLLGPCTICSSAWPSYRRDGERAGRLLSWVEPR